MLRSLTSLLAVILWLTSAHAAGGIDATQQFLKSMTVDHASGVVDYEYDECISLVEENDLLHEIHAIDFAGTMIRNYGFVMILDGSISDLRVDSNTLTRPGSLSLYFDEYGPEIGAAMLHLAQLCRDGVRR